MLRARGLLVLMALVGLGCNPPENPSDGGVDGGDGPEVCVAFPERIDANYTVAKGCWLVLKTPTIATAVTITVQPGAKLVFSEGTLLRISAEQVLTALGTADAPILFTGSLPVRGHWKGLFFEGTSSPSTLEYLTVEYGGDTQADSSAAGIKLIADSRGVRVGFSHVTVRESEGFGLWMTGSAVLPAFTANVLTKNGLGPISIDAATIGSIDSTTTYTGNDKDEVQVRGTRVATTATWDALGVPYHLTGDLQVREPGKLTLRPGVKLILPPEAALSVSGDAAALIANGTAQAPILLTGETQTRGAWEGVVFDNSNNADNLLRYVTIEYSGNTSSDTKAAGVLATADSSGVQVQFDHVVIRQSQGYGLRASGSALFPTFASVTLTGNALGAALIDSNAVHQLTLDSTYTGNDVDRVFVEGRWVSNAVVWRAIDVPYAFVGVSLTPQKVWTLEAGVTLEMGPMTRIDVGGGDDVGFHAAGTATKPVVITGIQKAKGSWDGIDYNGTLNAANVLDHCVIEYGGGGTRFGWQGMINSHSDSHGVNVSVTNSTVRHSAVWGIYFNNNQTGSVSGNTYEDNTSGDYHRDP
ncbi:MAG: hypothetical protein ACOZQL_31240 [Myxococcota bacterium]